jgi:hypothetical protein
MLTLGFNVLKTIFNVLTVVVNIKTTTYPSWKADSNTFKVNDTISMPYQNHYVVNKNKD